MQRNYRFRLYPNTAQIVQLEAMLSAFCDLYKAALHERNDCYRKTGRSLNYQDCTGKPCPSRTGCNATHSWRRPICAGMDRCE